MLKAVILAGGRSTRLRPITNTRPKMLVPILNRCVIDYVIERIKATSMVDEYIFTLHYFGEKILEHIDEGDSLGINPYFVREEKPLGTAGSVKNVERELSDTFLVVSGDILFDYDLKPVIQEHIREHREATIVLAEVKDVSGLGVVELDRDNRVTRFYEKPDPRNIGSGLINTGIYVLDKSVLNFIKPEQMFDFSVDLFPLLIKRGTLFGRRETGFWRDIGTYKGYFEAQADILNNRTKIRIPGKKIGHNIYAAKDAIIADPEKASGPALVGEGSVVAEGVILKNSVLGIECRVGQNSALLYSTLLNGTAVDAGSNVVGALIGEKSYVGPGKNIVGPVGFADGTRYE